MADEPKYRWTYKPDETLFSYVNEVVQRAQDSSAEGPVCVRTDLAETAQAIYRELKSRLQCKDDIYILIGDAQNRDRLRWEQQIRARFESTDRNFIVVGTSIIDRCLDYSFAFILTDCPIINTLIQIAGRLNRFLCMHDARLIITARTKRDGTPIPIEKPLPHDMTQVETSIRLLEQSSSSELQENHVLEALLDPYFQGWEHNGKHYSGYCEQIEQHPDFTEAEKNFWTALYSRKEGSTDIATCGLLRSPYDRKFSKTGKKRMFSLRHDPNYSIRKDLGFKTTVLIQHSKDEIAAIIEEWKKGHAQALISELAQHQTPIRAYQVNDLIKHNAKNPSLQLVQSKSIGKQQGTLDLFNVPYDPEIGVDLSALKAMIRKLNGKNT